MEDMTAPGEAGGLLKEKKKFITEQVALTVGKRSAIERHGRRRRRLLALGGRVRAPPLRRQTQPSPKQGEVALSASSTPDVVTLSPQGRRHDAGDAAQFGVVPCSAKVRAIP